MRAEVLTGPERQRRWREAERAEILAEFAKPGVRGADIMRRYGVSSGLLYTWRKKQRAALAAANVMPFAPVVLADSAFAAPPLSSVSGPAPSPPSIEITYNGMHVRLPLGVPPSLVAVILKTLRSRG